MIFVRTVQNNEVRVAVFSHKAKQRIVGKGGYVNQSEPDWAVFLEVNDERPDW
jgi:hypothetical protein